MSPTAFIALLLPSARAAAKEFGVPVSISIAQGALESSWGTRVPGNNYFGIKADKSWKGPTTDFVTHEVVKGKRIEIVGKFRAYASLQESVRDHAKFIKENPRYAACFKETTGQGWARALLAAGYATDPDYTRILINIMTYRKLEDLDTCPATAPV